MPITRDPLDTLRAYQRRSLPIPDRSRRSHGVRTDRARRTPAGWPSRAASPASHGRSAATCRGRIDRAMCSYEHRPCALASGLGPGGPRPAPPGHGRRRAAAASRPGAGRFGGAPERAEDSPL